MASRGPGCENVRSPLSLGFPSHAPRRRLNIAIRNPRTGEDEYPMLGLAAAPEVLIAVPTVMPPRPPYSFDLRYPSDQLPQNSGVMENDSALRCCHARLPPFTRLRVVLMMDS